MTRPDLTLTEIDGERESYLRFSVSLHGGRLAIVTVPIPMTKRNLERLKRMIEDQLEPFTLDGPPCSVEPRLDS